ncbi:MAG: hypothetical protein WBG42_16850 [Cryomorphaceae bacterium]
MTIRHLSFLLFICLIFASCKEDELTKYEGIWDGTFEGDELGTLKVRIKEDGVSEGVAYPAESGNDQSFVFKGSVNEDGELTMTTTVFGRDMVYNAFLTETELSGTWIAEEGNFNGTWAATKRVREDRFPYGPLLNP